MDDVQYIIRQILRDIQVELTDEFDKNFEREAFFTSAWQRRRSPIRDAGRGLLQDSGRLRQSIRSNVTADSITFVTSEPYAGTHNEGGEILVTERMKRFFWAKMYEAQGSFGRRKDGSARRDKRTVALTTEAEFWKMLALKKVGSTIRIPRRRFLGTSPEVEQAVREIIEENLTEYFETEFRLSD